MSGLRLISTFGFMDDVMRVGLRDRMRRWDIELFEYELLHQSTKS